MKALSCELCGGNNLVKDDGLFVCQNCGTKYTVEEARKLMIEGTVEVAGTVKIDSSDSVDKFLALATEAISGNNGELAFDYANRALEINPNNPEAWIVKMKSFSCLGTIGNPRISEMVSAGSSAIKFATDDVKQVKIRVYECYLERAYTLMLIVTQKLREDIPQLKSTFQKFALISPITAAKSVFDMDQATTSIYIKLLNEAYYLTLNVSKDDLVLDKKLINLLNKCAWQYKDAFSAHDERIHVYGAKPLDTALKARAGFLNEMNSRVSEASNVINSEINKRKQEQIEVYWKTNHREEYEELMRRKTEAEERKKELLNEKEEIPELVQVENYKTQINTLYDEKKKIGLFKTKERQEIQSKIDALTREQNMVLAVIEKKRNDIGYLMDEQDRIIKGIDYEINNNEEMLKSINDPSINRQQAGDGQSPSTEQSLSAADELRKYKKLMDDGVITEEEFKAKKEELLKLI